MEVFDVNDCTESVINLKTEKQLESLFEKIKDSADILVRWEDENEEKKHAKILLTDGLMSRIKDGRFHLTSSEDFEEEE